MAKTVKAENPQKVITGSNTRWSYANLWEPKSINGGTPKPKLPKYNYHIFLKFP